MVNLTQSDFTDWRQNKVTQAFFQAARERIDDAKELLSYSAGADPLADRELVGLIRAYRELQEFRLEDTE